MKSDSRGIARSWKSAGRLATVGIIGLVSAGCQSSTEPPQVWGKVSYHGEPVRGGIIVLSPEGGSGDSWGTGLIEDNGDYAVVSSQGHRPLAAGRYGVSFYRPAVSNTRKERHGHGHGGGGSSKPDIPEKYIDLKHPVFSIDLGNQPVQVDITLRD